MFQKGETIVCIRVTNDAQYITANKKYTVIKANSKYVTLVNDVDQQGYYWIYNFDTLSDYRKRKIDLIFKNT